MKPSHDLHGLMKFVSRQPWRDAFQAVTDAHFGPVLEEANLDFEDLVDILGPSAQMAAWGCAFEDALSMDFESIGNPADDYLKRRGFKETAQARAYIQGLRRSVMSLYEVSDIVPGESMLMRDLLRGGDPVRVREGTATKVLPPWQKVAARVVPVGDRALLAGGFLPFPDEAVELLREGLGVITGRASSDERPLDDDTLRPAAPLFTLTWLMIALAESSDEDLPDVRNRDGDPILFHDLRFPLAQGVAPAAVAARLDGVAALRPADERFWNWLATEGEAAGSSVVPKEAETLALDVTMDDGAPVLGNVTLEDDAVLLSVNSVARAGRGREFLSPVLGDLVGVPITTTQVLDEVMATLPSEDDAPALDAEEGARMVREMLDRHYHSVLGQPIAMLGDKSPRAAVRSKAGRPKVAEWLKSIENKSAGGPEGIRDYDFTWMWQALKLEDLRR